MGRAIGVEARSRMIEIGRQLMRIVTGRHIMDWLTNLATIAPVRPPGRSAVSTTAAGWCLMVVVGAGNSERLWDHPLCTKRDALEYSRV